MRTLIATWLERLSWWLEDVASEVEPNAAELEARRQDAKGRVPLVDRATLL